MTETPQEHIDRLQRELAAARVEQLQQELAAAQQDSEPTPASGYRLPRLGLDPPALPPVMPEDPGYAAPGFAAPGYTAPGYSAPGYAGPGYAGPGYSAADYAPGGYPVGPAAPGYPVGYPTTGPPAAPGWQPPISGLPPGADPALGQLGSVQAILGAIAANASPARAGMTNALFGQLQHWADQNGFGGAVITGHGPGPDAPGMDLPLAPPPRRVPPAFRIAMLSWRWWDQFTLFMVAVAPIAAWLFVPASAAAVGFVTLVVLGYFRLRGLRERIGILRWGVVAEVRSAGPLSAGTYYSGTTYQNVRLAVAHGWQVDRGWYSGPGFKSRIVYAVGGVEHELILRGRKYRDGVILADSRRPEVALCVSQFPYDLIRDQDGNWMPHIGFGSWLGAILQTAVYLGWLGLCTYLASVYWPPLL